MRYVIQYRSSIHPDAGWANMASIFYTEHGAEVRMRELTEEFSDKEWRVVPIDSYIGNSGTH